MIRTSSWFRFQPPPGWGESNEGGRIVYRSPNGEVLMVSSAAVTGQANEDEMRSVREQLLQNAFSSAMKTAAQPDLKITRKLAADDRISAIECWTMEAETLDAGEIFFQSIFRNGMGVLLATFEAYNSAAARLAYETFIKSVAGSSPVE